MELVDGAKALLLKPTAPNSVPKNFRNFENSESVVIGMFVWFTQNEKARSILGSWRMQCELNSSNFRPLLRQKHKSLEMSMLRNSCPSCGAKESQPFLCRFCTSSTLGEHCVAPHCTCTVAFCLWWGRGSDAYCCSAMQECINWPRPRKRNVQCCSVGTL